MAIYKFKSRYTDNDTSHLLPQNQPKVPNSWWWACLLCCCHLACSSRIRIGISTLVGLVLLVVHQNASSGVWGVINNQSPSQAHRQSYGYVNFPKWKWKNTKERYKSVHAKLKTLPSSAVIPTSPEEFPDWYENHVPVDFLCPTEHELSLSTNHDDDERSSSHWWICNPRHLNSIRNCRIYASGPTQLYTLLQQESLLSSCEIHYFDPSKRIPSTDAIIDNSTTTTTTTTTTITSNTIQVHHWGFAKETTMVASNDNNNTTTTASAAMDLKTLADTKKALGHKHVDLLLLHCAGCEWWLDFFAEKETHQISQMVLRMHDVQSPEWFETVTKNHYVLFHKEAVDISGTLGRGQVLSYLKLRKGFFE